jgi:hypothetical protein
VHLPQAGKEGFAFGVEDARAGRDVDRGARAGGDDAAFADEDGGVFDRWFAGGVDEAGTYDGEGSGGFGADLATEIGEV